MPVVKDVTFTVMPGQVLGYLGPNGSGKSTTVKMVTGLVQPTRGEILFEGLNIRNHLVEYKSSFGYVPEEANLYPHLTGKEYLDLVGRLRGLPQAVVDRRAEAFLSIFSLWSHRHTAVSAYSKGMRQRLLISVALLHDPRLVILDEPEAGLDVTTALVLRKLIASLAAEGKMVLFCSHILEVVEKVCSHVLVLYKGAVAAYDSIDGIRSMPSLPSLEAVFSEITHQTDTERAAREVIQAMRL